MKRRSMTLQLSLAIVCGLAAAFLAFKYLRSPAATGMARAAESPVGTVLVASRDMDLGRVLTPEDIREVDWPGDALPQGYSASASEVVGRGLLVPVRANEPLLSSKLARKEAGGGLPIAIPEGHRGVSVKVDEVIGVAGFVLPGTRVDVLVTLDQAARQDEPASRLILQNIQVLAAGQTVQRDEQGEPKTVPVITLLVTPQEAEKLTLAATKGRIQLALRNTLDMDSVTTPGVRARALIASQRPATPVRRSSGPSRPASRSVRVFRGPQMTESEVEGGQR